MALFEDEPFDEEFFLKENVNSYLSDPVKGLELVRTILSRQKQKLGGQTRPRHADIHNRVPALLAGLELDGEAEFYQRLAKLESRMKEQEMVSLLDGKVVLGIGGRFSAGKSCFINSITDAQLPEEQRETTSISTYVIGAQEKRNIALTAGGSSIELDDEAVQALTHQFYETYRIGFSRVIQNLAICSPSFRYSDIAILDTPGYNKADTGKMKGATDTENARQQLKSVDYLIWLIDIENGELKADDEAFIDSLGVSTPVLVIFNKAGIMPLEKVEAVVSNTSRRLADDKRNVFGVIAYDSWEKRTVFGGDTLERFLAMVDQDSQKKLTVIQQADKLCGDICSGIDCEIKAVKERRKEAETSLARATDTRSLGALVAEYISCGRKEQVLVDARKKIAVALSS